MDANLIELRTRFFDLMRKRVWINENGKDFRRCPDAAEQAEMIRIGRELRAAGWECFQ